VLPRFCVKGLFTLLDLSVSLSSSFTPAPKTPPGSPRQWVRWVGAVGLLLAAGLTAALLLLDPWLRQALEKQVAQRSQGRYQLHLAALHTSLWHRSIRLRGVRLRPAKDARLWTDTTALPRLLADVSELRLSGVGLWALLRGQELPIDTVLLAGVKLRVLHLPPSTDPRPLYQRLPRRLPGLAIGYVGLRGVQAAYGPARQPEASLWRADFTAQNVLINAAGAADTLRLGYAKVVQMRGRGLAVRRVQQHAVSLAGVLFSSTSGQLTLDSLRVRSWLKQGRREKQPKVNLTLTRLQLTGLQTGGLARQHLHLDSLLVTAQHLVFTPPLQPPPPVYQLLAPVLRRLTLGHARLTGGYLHMAGINTEPTVRAITLTGTNLRIDKVAAFDPARVFYAQRWQGHTGATNARLSAPVYRGGYRTLDLDTRPGLLQAHDVFILPTMSATQANRLKGHQAPNMTVHLPQLRVMGFDYAALDLHGALLARQITISRLHLLLDGDGNFPLNPSSSIVTPERLGSLKLRLNVRRLLVDNATIRTVYLSPSSGRRGALTFNRLSGSLTNVTNDPRLMSVAHPAVAEASGYVANRWRARLKIWLPLLDPNGGHWGQATFGPSSITVLNSMTEPSRNVRFARGDVRGATIRFRANRQQITGTMRAEYTGLKLELLSQKGGPDHRNLLTKVGTTLLNGIVVRDDNPRRAGQEPKEGSMTSRRELRVSVFSLWRQGLVSGLLNSIGAPKKLAQQISEQQ